MRADGSGPHDVAVYDPRPIQYGGAIMTDAGLPTYLNRGLSLSHAELCTQLGAELLSLCRSVTEDGRLTPEELDRLRQWLLEAESAEMPAAKHLRGVISKVLADGRITPDEYKEVHRAVEAVLPFDDRRQAMSARLEAEAAESGPRSASGLKPRPAFLPVGAVIALAVILAAAAAWLLA
jgi:predicted nucleic acid-binding protein